MADSDDTVKTDPYLSNWGDDGSIFDRLRDSGGAPGVKIGLLIRTAAGSALMFVAYTIISYVRAAAEAYDRLIDAGFSFLNDALGVLLGDGTYIVRGQELFSIDGPADFADSVFRSAEATLSNAEIGFIVAFAMVLSLATIVWGVRRYAL